MKKVKLRTLYRDEDRLEDPDVTRAKLVNTALAGLRLHHGTNWTPETLKEALWLLIVASYGPHGTTFNTAGAASALGCPCEVLLRTARELASAGRIDMIERQSQSPIYRPRFPSAEPDDVRAVLIAMRKSEEAASAPLLRVPSDAPKPWYVVGETRSHVISIMREIYAAKVTKKPLTAGGDVAFCVPGGQLTYISGLTALESLEDTTGTVFLLTGDTLRARRFTESAILLGLQVWDLARAADEVSAIREHAPGAIDEKADASQLVPAHAELKRYLPAAKTPTILRTLRDRGELKLTKIGNVLYARRGDLHQLMERKFAIDTQSELSTNKVSNHG